MTNAMDDYAEVTAPRTVRVQRLLPGPIERVWAYLTESELRATWLAGGEMDLREGGQVELRFMHSNISAEKPPERFKEHEHRTLGTITRCEPPYRLSYSWGGERDDSEVSFELQTQGKSVLLTLTHQRLRDRKAMLSVGSGWHAHLGILSDRLHGNEPQGFWSALIKLEAEYDRRLPRD